MTGYSDRINHAFSFAAKYARPRQQIGDGARFPVQFANVAIILARYGCDEPTIVAGILHHVLEESYGAAREDFERKIAEKFGPVVVAIAKDACEPRLDARGAERPWQACKQDFMAHLAIAEPRALDICVADEMHSCGTTMTALRRLGVEYLRTVSNASSEQTIWWYRSMLEIVEGRADWPLRPVMLPELRRMSTQLVRGLRRSEEELY